MCCVSCAVSVSVCVCVSAVFVVVWCLCGGHNLKQKIQVDQNSPVKIMWIAGEELGWFSSESVWLWLCLSVSV